VVPPPKIPTVELPVAAGAEIAVPSTVPEDTTLPEYVYTSVLVVGTVPDAVLPPPKIPTVELPAAASSHLAVPRAEPLATVFPEYV